MRKYNAPENSIGHRLEIALAARKLSAARLAGLVKTTRGAISQQLNGGGMNAETLVKISRVLHVSPWWLALGEGEGPDGSVGTEAREPGLGLSYSEQSLLMSFRALSPKSQRAVVALLSALQADAEVERTSWSDEGESVEQSLSQAVKSATQSPTLIGDAGELGAGDGSSKSPARSKARVGASRKPAK